MPEDFLKCVKNKGRVRTISLPNNRYMAVCFIGGRSYHGEVHHNKGAAKVAQSKRKSRKSATG